MAWGVNSLIGLVVATAAATGLATVANATDFASKTAAICQSTTSPVELKAAALEIGWTVSAPSDLDDRAIQSYAASLLSNQLGYGDVPDVRIVRVWETALLNAAGARNLKNIEGSPQKDLWFVWEQTGSVLRVDSFENEVFGRLNCIIALKDADSPITFRDLLGDSDRDPQTLPPVYHLKPKSSEAGGFKRRLNGAILNTDRISAATGSALDVATVYTTIVFKNPEKSE